MTPDHWQAVALSRDLGRRPLRVMLEGAPIVLFHTAGGLAALADRCPHRLVELSGGRVCGEALECPYHGWRFDAAGQCVAIPGHLGELPRARVPVYAVTEADGAIFVAKGTPPAPPYTHCMAGKPVVQRLVQSRTRSTLIDAAENILDATHTHFTHKGLLRGLSSQRFRVRVEVTGGPAWVEATYTGEERQKGLVSALLDGARVRTVGRYRHPGIAELEYWGPKGIVLATTFHLRQADATTVEGIGWLVGPRGGLLGQLKALAFKPLFRIALAQDRRVLRSAFENARLAPGAAPIIGPLDFLRRDIEAIAAGDLPPAATTPQSYEIEL
jgi:phenylpropionate dioxygenase-like ring-hydroxylating dioxygenase large terminal subunit